MKAVRGFTMVELMITLVIASILVAIAVPNFRLTMQNNQMINAANSTIGALQFARMQAVNRANTVYLGQRNGIDWNGGIVVWLDTDASGTDGVYDAGEEIRFWESLGGDLNLTSAATQFQFLATGGLSVANDMTLCDSARTGETGRTIETLVSGMVAISEVTCS